MLPTPFFYLQLVPLNNRYPYAWLRHNLTKIRNWSVRGIIICRLVPNTGSWMASYPLAFMLPTPFTAVARLPSAKGTVPCSCPTSRNANMWTSNILGISATNGLGAGPINPSAFMLPTPYTSVTRFPSTNWTVTCGCSTSQRRVIFNDCSTWDWLIRNII